MENASKALLMAGGILIAIILVGLLLVMFNNIGAFKQSQSDSAKDSQIVAFNSDFDRYVNDKEIYGADLITLANKVIDFNAKSGEVNSINYDQGMKLEINGIDQFQNKYAYDSSTSLFGSNTHYTIAKGNKKNPFADLLNEYNSLDIQLYKKLSTVYNSNDKAKSKAKIKEELLKIDEKKYENWNGSNEPKMEVIAHFKEYTEFKTAKFKLEDEPEYKNGQIYRFNFVFSR